MNLFPDFRSLFTVDCLLLTVFLAGVLQVSCKFPFKGRQILAKSNAEVLETVVRLSERAEVTENWLHTMLPDEQLGGKEGLSVRHGAAKPRPYLHEVLERLHDVVVDEDRARAETLAAAQEEGSAAVLERLRLEDLLMVTVVGACDEAWSIAVSVSAALCHTLSSFTWSSACSTTRQVREVQVTGLPLWFSILCTGVLTTTYTTLGGMKAVIWTDVMQFCVLMGGQFVILWVAVSRIPDGLAGV